MTRPDTISPPPEVSEEARGIVEGLINSAMLAASSHWETRKLHATTLDELKAEALRYIAGLEAIRKDAKTVAGFVVGWWPGLEDGITSWSDPGAQAEDRRLLAAQRILAAIDTAQEKPE